MPNLTAKRFHFLFKEDYTEEKKNFLLSQKSGVDKIKQEVVCVETGEIFNSITDAAKFVNRNESNIRAVLYGRIETCGKDENGKRYHWKYLDETKNGKLRKVKKPWKIRCLETGEVFTGNVVWSDMDVDLAILKISAKNLIYAKLGDSDNIKVGEKVYAIGNPIGFEFERTVTSGIISAIDRTIKIEEDENSYMSNLIQTDATINLGNSGGPLINIDGEVVGINTLKITSAEGISFAVPINLVKTIIEKFATQGKFEEASIGIFAYDKNVIPYIDNNLKFNTGIYVVQIDRNSSAYNSGLREKDVIIQIDNINLEKMCDLRRYIYTKNIGDEVILKILRNNTEKEIKMTLIKK